ncbi:YdcF family protein [Flavisolibacter sp. BT320]|nr:YdcF family protein [Flavisolibacter longurius]
MRIRKKRLVSFGLLVLCLFLVVVYCNNRANKAGEGKLFSAVEAVPANHVGLLLGTGKYLGSGAINPYYQYRVEAAAKLLADGKINYLVISGDNSRKAYNEPEMMRADLVAAGIDSSRIFLDFAGFRTFDSMVRLREIFSQQCVTVISQKFHNERALFIAQKEGIAAIGFNAKDVSASAGFKTQLREKLARVKVFIDYLLATEPRFLGPKVSIP